VVSIGCWRRALSMALATFLAAGSSPNSRMARSSSSRLARCKKSKADGPSPCDIRMSRGPSRRKLNPALGRIELQRRDAQVKEQPIQSSFRVAPRLLEEFGQARVLSPRELERKPDGRKPRSRQIECFRVAIHADQKTLRADPLQDGGRVPTEPHRRVQVDLAGFRVEPSHHRIEQDR
jgi:hypothetical protein